MFRLCENCRLKQIFDENVFDDDTVIISSVITADSWNVVWAVSPPFYQRLTSISDLRDSKENLDFSQYYNFVVEEAIQGFYWQNSQATLHTFAVYYRS